MRIFSRFWRPPPSLSPSPSDGLARLSSLDLTGVMKFWPLFPRVREDLSPLLFRKEKTTRKTIKFIGYDGYDLFRLNYWRQLAPVYVAALQEPDGDGLPQPCQVVIETWPKNIAGQQAALTALLAESKLCAAWRAQQRWYQQGGYRQSNSATREAEAEALEQAHGAGSRPLAEIPVYQWWYRCSCQQLVCLPLAQWLALFDPAAHYEPASVDTQTVTRLATRIARAFNIPPQEAAERARDFLHLVPTVPTVWPTSLRGLTSTIDAHGMADNYEQALRDAKEGEAVPMPERRFDGFYGCLRVTLENGEVWMLAVLGPGHFVSRLMKMGYGLKGER